MPKNLLESDVFKRSYQDLIDVNILTESIQLSEKYWELFYKHKTRYIMETMMFPIHILFESPDLGNRIYDYYHIVQNIMIHEKPEYLESLMLEQKHFERIMDEEKNG